ncbi:MAG: ABC transporter substrate-binding protein [Pseudomonadota bacterium]
MRRWSGYVAGVVLATLAPSTPATAKAPERVVSMNLCTDQLAMLLAAPGQLQSVTYIARDPRASAMSEEAEAYPINRGLAEEIYLMQPDLVIAGAFSTRATVAMLKRLGIPVVVFDPAYSLEDVRDRILQMGSVLGREAAAEELLRDFDARLVRLQANVAERPRAVLYYANGYTSGDQSLAGQILAAAGFANVAVEAGFQAGDKLPLEVLVMTDPDIAITSRPYVGASRAEAILDHPAIVAFRAGRAGQSMTDRDWVCGTPYVLRAIEALSQARQNLVGGK